MITPNKPSISKEVREHLVSHFGNTLPGSKFYANSPDLMLEQLVQTFPDAFTYARPDADGRIRIHFQFTEPIGESNVVSLNELTKEEISTIHIVDRNGISVRCVISSRVKPTCHCCAIFTSDWQLITMFPGEMAPPLPESPDIHDDFWDNHVFIEPESK